MLLHAENSNRYGSLSHFRCLLLNAGSCPSFTQVCGYSLIENGLSSGRLLGPQKVGTTMTGSQPRITREKTTIEAMMKLYCTDHHNTRNTLCSNCQNLMDYAMRCLEKCPFHEKKPTCANCRIHCYQPAMRIKIRAVMRYAGPRMIYKHPVLALRHILDGFKKPGTAPTSQGEP